MMNLLLLFTAFSVMNQAPIEKPDQAYLGIFAETTAMKMVGMPDIELPPGVDPSMIPGLADMLGGRKLTIRLWSPSIAPDNAAASIAPPPGLKQGQKLDLELYRPKPDQKSEPDDSDFDTSKMKEMTIKIYWGSSATVKENQPKIIKFGDLSPAQVDEMRKQAKEMARKKNVASYFYKPGWTTGYWPTKKQPGKIAKDAMLTGGYSLTTNYCGNVQLDAPTNVEFLAPIEFTSPSFKNKLDFTQSLNFEWKQIQYLLGSCARITAMEGQNTIIMWYSSEVYDQSLMNTNWDFMQMADVLSLVKKTAMMAGDRTSVIVPAGIFKDADFVSMVMTGYGPGASLPEGQPLPRIQTKTSITVMLGGKKMENMGGEE
jgi:hypothetical protein